jgi:transposase
MCVACSLHHNKETRHRRGLRRYGCSTYLYRKAIWPGRSAAALSPQKPEIPNNMILHLLPPYSPELNPQENLWDEIRETIFKNYALITSFPYIAKSL